LSTALITGASGGIGLELAKVFAREKWDLVLVARSAAKLEQAASGLSKEHGVRCHAISQDLSRRDSSEALFAETSARSLRIDALVNNAGIGTFGPFAETDLAGQTDMLEINVMSLTRLTRLFLTSMLARRQGYVLNVASTAAFQPGPLMAVYYASKAYVLHFSEALNDELRGSGVSVSALCPGATRTDFQERAQMTRSKLFNQNVMHSEAVARAGYEGMMRGKSVIVPGVVNKIVANSARFTPRGLMTRVVRRVQEIDKKKV
jgi:uncharacterized protein